LVDDELEKFRKKAVVQFDAGIVLAWADMA
jgi:hypothetical protein